FRGVGIRHHVEFTDRIDAEEIAADAAGCDGKLARAGVLYPVEQKQVFTSAPPGDRKGVAVAGAGVGAFHGAVIDCAGVEGNQSVVTAAVQGQILDFPLSDDTRRRGGGRVDDRNLFGDGDLFRHFTYFQVDVDHRLLPHREADTGSHFGLKPSLFNLYFLGAQGQGRHTIIARFLGGYHAGGAGFQAFDGDRRATDTGTRRIHDPAGDRSGHLRPTGGYES